MVFIERLKDHLLVTNAFLLLDWPTSNIHIILTIKFKDSLKNRIDFPYFLKLVFMNFLLL
jgi:hypothetical protein